MYLYCQKISRQGHLSCTFYIVDIIEYYNYSEGKGMKRKKKTAIFLSVFLALSFCLTGISSSVRAANKNNYRYYYHQLSAEAKQIYDAMYQMYEQDIFQTGTQSYDLVGNGHMSKEQMAAYDGNFDGLLKSFGAARDAFYADYPDIFYVDFSSLAISVESGADGYKAYLGMKAEDTPYFVKGFTDSQQVESAINAHEAKVNEIVQGAKSNAQSPREQVIYIHNAIIENTSYHLETDCSPGNEGHVRTSYGALVKGESLCEGYARAVKTVLDSLGIPSVLVQGYYQDTDGSRNLHMWNYVQLDGKWYAVDATADDGMKGAAEKDAYLLVDGEVMGKHHIPDGVMSPAGIRFTYPLLEGKQPENPDSGTTQPDNPGTTQPDNPGTSQPENPQPGDGNEQEEENNPAVGTIDSQGYKIVFSEDGLVVGYRDGTEAEGDVGIFKVSYKGMGYLEAAKEGVYILSRFYQYIPATGENRPDNWGYSDPTPFTMPQLEDALVIANGNSRILEFAVTRIPPKGPLYGEGLSAEEIRQNWTFQGTESDFFIATGQLENPKGTYVPAPYVRRLTPGNTGFLKSGVTYTITAEYDEPLEEYDGQKAGYSLTVKDGWSAVENSKIEDFKWDGDRTITFRFTPSQMLADSSSTYNFEITGLRGKESLKVPGGFQYDVKRKICICAYRPQGYQWNVFGKPALLEPTDLSCKGWELASGEKLEDVVTNIVLVASKPELVITTPNAEQNDIMLDKIENELGDEVIKSATYNIDLKMCNTDIVKTGNSVRMSVGFPEGYGPDSEGVVFKAYHFIKKDGKIVGVEPIDCVVTEYGLVIATKSFSPFAVCAVKEDNTEPPVKKVLFLNSAGGEVEGDAIRVLEKSQPAQTVTVRAKEGYQLSSINVSGEEVPITNNKTMSISLSYNSLAYDENIVDVNFVAEQPKQTEQTKQPEQPVQSANEKKPSDSGKNSRQESSSSKEEEGGQESGQTPAQSSEKPKTQPASLPVNNSAAQTAPAATPAPSAQQPAGGGEKQPVSDTGQIEDIGLKEEAEEDRLVASAEETTDEEPPAESAEPEENTDSEEEAFETPQITEDKTFGIILAVIGGIGVISIAGIIIAKWRR